MEFRTDHAPLIGGVEWLEEDIRCVTAPNASPMTFTGTRSYILGRGRVALIDPGPDDPRHLAALREALEGEEVEAVFVTHAHRDHSPLARSFGAPVHAFGAAEAGRSAVMAGLGAVGGGEGVDAGFAPDLALADGQEVTGDGWSLTAVHTPGHMSSHLAFASGDRLFSGDHVMGWATTLISPPDGDLTQFMAALDTCLARPDRVYYPGHGAPVEEPHALVRHIRDHRRGREAQILAALERPGTVREVTERVYRDLDPALMGAASRNVLAHLVDLWVRGLVATEGEPRADGVYRRA